MPKVKITKTPGSQSNYSLVGRNSFFPATGTGPSEEVKHTMGAVDDPSLANAEVEGGETVVGDVNNDGFIEHMEFKGRRHNEGGIPVTLPQGSFIFSDTRKLKIKDKTLLKDMFDVSYKSGGVTPADISKKYRLNDYMNILKDKDVDELSKRTANEMIQNNLKKLGELALIQESMKGFPDGIPEISESIAASMGLIPQGEEQMQLGGFFKDGGYIRKYELAGGVDPVKPKPHSYSNQQHPYISTYDPNVLRDFNSRGITLTPAQQDLLEGLDKDIVPGMQHTRRVRVYGDQDYHQGQYFDDFKKRFPEFFAENPDFNPTAQGAVSKFQDWYNKNLTSSLQSAGYNEQEIQDIASKQGFVNQKGVPNSLDDKFGRYTWSRPRINFTKPPAPVTPPGTEEKPPDKPVQEKEPPKKEDYNVDAPQNPGKKGWWWLQDRVNFAGAMLDTVNKYDPLLQTIEQVPYGNDLKHTTRLLAANQEQQNSFRDYLKNTVDGNVGAATMLGAAGQGFTNAANAISSVENENVQISNAAKGTNAQLQGQVNLLNANARQKYNQDVATLGQNYDNAQRNLKANRINAFNQGTTNWHKKNWMEQVLFPQVFVDPLSGHVDFSGKNRSINNDTYVNPYTSGALSGAGVRNNPQQNMQNLSRSYVDNHKVIFDYAKQRGYTDEQAEKMALSGSQQTYRFAQPNAQTRNMNYFGYQMPWEE
jgi:hypothetical protein